MACETWSGNLALAAKGVANAEPEVAAGQRQQHGNVTETDNSDICRPGGGRVSTHTSVACVCLGVDKGASTRTCPGPVSSLQPWGTRSRGLDAHVLNVTSGKCGLSEALPPL